MSTSPADTPAQQRLLARERANHIRAVRAELKRQLRAGEVKAVETILRRSHYTDTTKGVPVLARGLLLRSGGRRLLQPALRLCQARGS